MYDSTHELRIHEDVYVYTYTNIDTAEAFRALIAHWEQHHTLGSDFDIDGTTRSNEVIIHLWRD